MGFWKKTLSVVLLAALLLPVTGVRATETQPLTAVREMEILPGNWNPLSQDTPEKEFIRDLTSAKLYRLSGDGSAVLPELAAALPRDVTAEYAGTYGISANARRGYAFRIDLNEKACWEDGKAITAEDLLFSLGLLQEEPFFASLANARSYLAGREKRTENVISLDAAGFATVREAKDAGYTEFYVDLGSFWGLEAGWKSVSDQTQIRDYAMPGGLNEYFVTPAYIYSQYLADGKSFARYQSEFVGVTADLNDRLTFEDVGFFATGERQITLILTEPTTVTALALKLEVLHLFREELWDDTYGTSPETYSACGPYRIVSAGIEEILLERNPNWWGEEGEYDRILCRRPGDVQ